VDVVGLQALHGHQRELLLDLLRTAMGTGRLFLGGPDQQLEVLAAGGAMEVKEGHDVALLIDARASLPIRKTPAGIRLEGAPTHG
jgi:hypothetical protein